MNNVCRCGSGSVLLLLISFAFLLWGKDTLTGQSVLQTVDSAKWSPCQLEVNVYGSSSELPMPLNATITVHYGKNRTFKLHRDSGSTGCDGQGYYCSTGRLPLKPVTLVISHEGYETLSLPIDVRRYSESARLKVIRLGKEPVLDVDTYFGTDTRSILLHLYMKKPGQVWTHIRYGRYPYRPGVVLVYGPTDDLAPLGVAHSNPNLYPQKDSAMPVPVHWPTILDSLPFHIQRSICGGWLIEYSSDQRMLTTTIMDSLMVALRQQLFPYNLRAMETIGGINEYFVGGAGIIEAVVVNAPAIVLRTTLDVDSLRSLVEPLGLQWGKGADNYYHHSQYMGEWTFILPMHLRPNQIIDQLLTHDGIVDAYFASGPSCSTVTDF